MFSAHYNIFQPNFVILLLLKGSFWEFGFFVWICLNQKLVYKENCLLTCMIAKLLLTKFNGQILILEAISQIWTDISNIVSGGSHVPVYCKHYPTIRISGQIWYPVHPNGMYLPVLLRLHDIAPGHLNVIVVVTNNKLT